MTRLLIFLFVAGLSTVASAQVSDASKPAAPPTTGRNQLPTSVEAEARARDEAFAQWKVRYANNRAWVASEIKAVRQELTQLRAVKPEPGQRFTDLLNGTIRRWNEEKTDYADPEQFAECREFLTTLKTDIQTEQAKK